MTKPPTSSPDLAAPRARDQLLATKLSIPRTRPDRLARSRLFQRLDEGIARELTLVCAPAGFGKTTLLADWATRASCPVAWLSLDEGTTTRRASGGMWSRRWTAPAAAASPSRCCRC